jgi:hypothetical protein
MIDSKHAVSIGQQAELLGISRVDNPQPAEIALRNPFGLS